MSVSDVIVIEKEHEKTAYYVDSFGFTKVADFLEEKRYHSAETEQAVSRFREKTKQNFRLLYTSSSYCLLCSLEKLDEEGNFLDKADMFSKRTIKKTEVVTSVDTCLLYTSRCV